MRAAVWKLRSVPGRWEIRKIKAFNLPASALSHLSALFVPTVIEQFTCGHLLIAVIDHFSLRNQSNAHLSYPLLSENIYNIIYK